jgi:hypothetical protein
MRNRHPNPSHHRPPTYQPTPRDTYCWHVYLIGTGDPQRAEENRALPALERYPSFFYEARRRTRVVNE